MWNVNSFEISTRRPLLTKIHVDWQLQQQQYKQHLLVDELKREYVFNVFICRIARKLPLVCTLQRSLLFLLPWLPVWCYELDKFSSHLTNLPRLTRCLYYITQFTLRYIYVQKPSNTHCLYNTAHVQYTHSHT